MGLLDKARDAATQAVASAQSAAQQGQAKLNEYQEKKASTNELYRALGEAFYREQRKGGSHESTVWALQAMDEHLAAQQPPPPTSAPPTTPPPTTPPPATPQ